jgi:hypothetical protein
MNDEQAIQRVEEQFGIITSRQSFEEKLQALALKINDLLNNDFQKLISLLYRMDINESKLRRLLEENKNTDAGLIIAKMMIEREAQKIKSRKESMKKNNQDSTEEKW